MPGFQRSTSIETDMLQVKMLHFALREEFQSVVLEEIDFD